MTRRSFLLTFLLALCSFQAPAAEPAPGQWIVVTAPEFKSALEPLCQYRKSLGMHVVVLQTTDVLTPGEILDGDAAKLRDRVNQLCREAREPSYVLLVGAVEAGHLDEAAKKVLPPLPGTVGRMKDQPSDHGYGCPGKAFLASVPVGRLPARTKEEAGQMVQKTLAYERNHEPGEWRRQMTVLAGVPAFNPMVDRLVENLALARFGKIDPSWTGRAIYHNAQSRFCVPDDRLHDLARQYVQEGQAYTLYLGHSDARGFYAGRARFLERDDWADMIIDHGPGIFATFGCLGCQLIDSEGEGYGLAAIRNPGGPVAVIGSHGICFAAMVQLAADGLFRSVFTGQPPERLGQAWLALQEGLAAGKIDGLSFKLLDMVDGDSNIPQAAQRLEHQEMFVLLGDPALRLPVLSSDIQLTCDQEAAAGKSLSLKGKLPDRLAGARVRLTLERPADSEPTGLEPLPPGPPEERACVMLANHQRANAFVLVTKVVPATQEDFEADLDLPKKLPWQRLTVRAYAVKAGQEGLGILTLPIQPAEGLSR